MCKALYTSVQALFLWLELFAMIDKVSQEILKFQYICLQVLIISSFERMSHSESVKFIFKMTHLQNVPS